MKKHSEERAMAADPFDDEEVLARTFYSHGDPTNGLLPLGPMEGGPKPVKEKPTHYRVVSVSLYNDDIEMIDKLVKELKRRGFTKMNRSALIRFAIDTVVIDDLPRQY
jgi:hypothetical protein